MRDRIAEPVSAAAPYDDVILRRATAADAPQIAEIRRRTIRSVVAPLGGYTAEQIAEWSSNYPASRVEGFIRDELFLVAELKGAVVGFGRVRIDPPDEATIRGVFIDADHIGKGIGGKIVEELISIARCHGTRRVNLTATLNAESFYARHGFVSHGRVMHSTPNTAEVPAVRMSQDLGCAA